MPQLRFVLFGLSITSSWGNGHATTYRGLVRELAARGHDVLFLERDVPWYSSNRDLPKPPYGKTLLYQSVEEAKDRFSRHIRQADVVMVGSYVPDGVAIGEWVISHTSGIAAFYDIDTPVTMAKLARGDEEYLSASLVSQYDLYLSFTGGPILRNIERRFRSPRARVLYCSVDPEVYRPEEQVCKWDLDIWALTEQTGSLRWTPYFASPPGVGRRAGSSSPVRCTRRASTGPPMWSVLTTSPPVVIGPFTIRSDSR